MQKLLRYRLQIVILVIAAGAAIGGLYIAGVLGGGHAVAKKVTVEPVALDEPFIINLADTDAVHYMKLSLAVQLEPMTEEEKLAFETAPEAEGHGGGGDAVTGPIRVATDPTLRDAVITTVARFTSKELLTPAGKQELKQALLQSFDAVAQDQAPPAPPKGEKAATHDPAHPPFHIEKVYFEEYAVQ